MIWIPEITDNSFESIDLALKYTYKKLIDLPNAAVYVCDDQRVIGEIISIGPNKIVYTERDHTRGKNVTPDGILRGVYTFKKNAVHIIIGPVEEEVMQRINYLKNKSDNNEAV